MSFRIVFSRLANIHHTPSTIPPIIRLSLKAPASTSRAFSTSRPSPFRSASPVYSPFRHSNTTLASVFTKSFPRLGLGAASAVVKRGVATSPIYGEASRAPVDWRRVGVNIGIGIVAAVGINFALNSEHTAGLIGFEGEYLRSTFKWTAGGLIITAATAYLSHANGLSYRLMAANPWLVMGAGLVLSIGSMMGVYYTAPDSPAHYLSWAVFSAMQGVTLSPMFFFNPAILSRAGIYTLGALAGISYVGATAQSEAYLWIGGPLLCGLGVLIATSIAPMLMPRMALSTLTTLEYVSAYGGVALFSGFILYDTQKIRRNAQLAQRGAIPADPIRESISLILDAINLFVRIVQVMMLQGNRKK